MMCRNLFNAQPAADLRSLRVDGPRSSRLSSPGTPALAALRGGVLVNRPAGSFFHFLGRPPPASAPPSGGRGIYGSRTARGEAKGAEGGR